MTNTVKNIKLKALVEAYTARQNYIDTVGIGYYNNHKQAQQVGYIIYESIINKYYIRGLLTRQEYYNLISIEELLK